MKKYLQLPILLVLFLLMIFFSPKLVAQVSAQSFSLSPAEATLDSGGGVVNLNIDTGGQSLESATAVVTFDESKASVTSSSSDFFPIVSVDDSTSGEIVITGNVNFGDQVGKSGTGTLTTLTVSPKTDDATINLSFRCSSLESDDSNMMTIDGSNLLSTDEQCTQNSGGTYTVGSGGSNTTADPSPTSSSTKGGQTASQPAAPASLPQSGAFDIIKWLTSGLALIGIGLLLL